MPSSPFKSPDDSRVYDIIDAHLCGMIENHLDPILPEKDREIIVNKLEQEICYASQNGQRTAALEQRRNRLLETQQKMLNIQERRKHFHAFIAATFLHNFIKLRIEKMHQSPEKPPLLGAVLDSIQQAAPQILPQSFSKLFGLLKKELDFPDDYGKGLYRAMPDFHTMLDKYIQLQAGRSADV